MQNVWLVRTLLDGHNRFKEFENENIIAIGWSRTGDLTDKTKIEMQQMLQKNYLFNSDQQLRYVMGRVNAFIYKISKNDIAIVPEHKGSAVNIGIIKSDYIYNSEKTSEGYCHQRKVTWKLQTTCNQLPMEVQKFLYRCPANGQMKNNSELVRSLINSESINSYDTEIESLSTSYETDLGKSIDNLTNAILSVIAKKFKSADSDKKIKMILELLNLQLKF